MALRRIRVEGDETLRKTSKEVKEIDDKCKTLMDDMIETMYEANGIGLAAPQVGILKRIFVMDLHDGNGPMVFVNPEFMDKEGEQISCEGCLSIPGFEGEVVRPGFIRIKALDKDGNEFIYEGEGIAAVCVSHEYDHLVGVLFRDKAIEKKNE